MRRRALTAAFLLLLASAPGFIRASDPAAPDPVIQTQIDRTVQAIITMAKGGDESTVRREIDRLVAHERERLLVQIAVYLSKSESTEESMGGAVLLDQLGFSEAEKLDAVIPALESADPDLHVVLSDLLGTLEGADCDQPDYRVYDGVLREAQGGPLAALVRYMYQGSPAEAMAAMERLHGNVSPDERGMVDTVDKLVQERDNGRRLSEAETAELAASLDRLSGSSVWWVRLYAAATIARQPKDAKPETAERLRQDAHPLVRELSPE